MTIYFKKMTEKVRTFVAILIQFFSKRKHLISFKAPVNTNASLIVRKISSDPTSTEAIRIVKSDGMNINADSNPDGSSTLFIQGTPRQGEEGIRAICGLFIEKLNQLGQNWSNITVTANVGSKSETGIDCKAFNDENETLEIQVVRALSNPEIYRQLALTRKASQSYNQAFDNAKIIMSTINKKCGRISQRDRISITLVLDSTETPTLVFKDTIRFFRKKYGAEAKKLGFRNIWIVGPTVDLVEKLDFTEEELISMNLI
jgi:hypothetical protein